MTRLSATRFASANTCAKSDRASAASILLGGLLIIGLPVTFWIAVLELVNYALSLDLSSWTRLSVAGVLIGLSSLIWRYIYVSAGDRALLDAEHSRGDHCNAARKRFDASPCAILILHDTTEVPGQRSNPYFRCGVELANSGKDSAGSWRHRTIPDLSIEASLAIRTDGLPLGLTAVNIWTLKPFEGTGAHAEESNHSRGTMAEKTGMRWFENLHQSIDLLGQSARCIHVRYDQGSIFELDVLAREAGTHFLVRISAEGLVENAGHTIPAETDDVAIDGVQNFDVCNDKGEASADALDIKSSRIHNLPLISNRKC